MFAAQLCGKFALGILKKNKNLYGYFESSVIDIKWESWGIILQNFEFFFEPILYKNPSKKFIECFDNAALIR